MLDFAAIDLILAILHHLLIFGLAGVLAFEIGALHAAMTGKSIVRIARVDLWYGVLAAAILLVGFSRTIFAAKGWAYYSHNLFFWAKLAAFALVGLLSLPPTFAYLGWRRGLNRDPGFLPPLAEAQRRSGRPAPTPNTTGY